MLRRLLLGHRKVEEFTRRALDTPCCKEDENNDGEESDENETSDYSSSDTNSQEDDQELHGFQIIDQPEKKDCIKEENEEMNDEIVETNNQMEEQKNEEIIDEENQVTNNDNNFVGTTQSPDNPKTPPPTPHTPKDSSNSLLKKKQHMISQLPVRKTTQRGGKPPYTHINHAPYNHHNHKPNGRRNDKRVLKYEPQLKRFSDFKGGSGCFNDVSKTSNESAKFSVDDLEHILGINITELRDVISQARMDKKGSMSIQGRNNREIGDSSGLDKSKIIKVQKTTKANTTTRSRKYPDAGDHKDETSSDSGVSEGHGDQEYENMVPERYMTKRSIVKYKVHLEKKLSQLESKMTTIVEHQKDVHFIYDVIDLYNDELKNVNRNSVGVPCVAALKQILGRQLQEMSDTEFQSKLKCLKELRIPSFSVMHKNIQNLEIKLKGCLQDDRKCRSKSVQTIRYEIGKILGMCQGLLDCVYED